MTEAFTVASSGATVFGSAGREVISINAGVTNVVLDQNIDRVSLPDLSSNYTYKQAGNQLIVYDAAGTTAIVAMPIQGDTDGTQVGFANGTFNASITAGALVLGGATVNPAAPATLSPVTPTTTPEPTPAVLSSAAIYMGSGDAFTVANNGVHSFGSTGIETLTVAAGFTNVVFDQNTEQLQLTGLSSSYRFLQTGNQINVYDATGTTLLAKGPVQGDSDGTSISFSDGASAVVISSGVMQLGNVALSSTTPSAVSLGGATPVVTPPSLTATAAAFSKVDNDIGDLLAASATGPVSLRSGEQWGVTALTYSFNTSAPAEYTGVSTDDTLSGTLTSGWLPLNTAEKAAVRDSLADLSGLVPLTFTEVAGNTGDLRFNVLPIVDGTTGFAYYPSTSTLGGDVFLASANRAKYAYLDGDHGKLVVVHEIGHAMGLKHPFESPNVLAADLDDYTHTTMSYTSGRSMLLDFTYSGGSVHVQGTYTANPSNYSILDVAALQASYGANTSYRTGADTYSASYSEHRYQTIWDAGGGDTLEAAAALGACSVDLRPGSFCSMDVHTIAMQRADTQAYYHGLGVNWADSWVADVYANTDYTASLYTGENNVAIANGVWMENATTGAGADIIRDNAVNNAIVAGAGDDLVKLFEGGYDTVDGGAGFDTVQVNNTHSQVQSEKQADGSYLIAGTYFGAKLIGVEKLLFSDGELLLA